MYYPIQPATIVNKLLMRSIFVLILGLVWAIPGYSQLGPFDKDRGKTMLSVLKEDLKKNYYDSNFHGVNIDTRFKETEERIKQATSNSQILGMIAQLLIEFNDSHTFFVPPERSVNVEYGWVMQMIGDKCYILGVKPGSDAEAKGVKPGDQVLAINGFRPSRPDLWKIEYTFNLLRPQAGLRLALQSPGSTVARQVDVMAKVKPGKQIRDLTVDEEGNSNDINEIIRQAQNQSRVNQHRYYDLEKGDLTIYKMPDFEISESEIDTFIERTRKRKAMIIDLRGNAGGYLTTLTRFVGHFFEKDVKIGELKSRKDNKPLVAKGHGNKAFKGQLVLLVDSKSASAAEIFARVMQLEKRATVIGDTTAGSVMASRQFVHKMGTDVVIFYAASITVADIAMSDGQSLENVGVKPDEILLVKPAELAANQDSVMARAMALVDIEIDPESAAKLFPLEWTK